MLLYLSVGLAFAGAVVAILTDAALKYSNDQPLVNRKVCPYPAMAVLSMVVNAIGLHGIVGKTGGGVILGIIGLGLGALGWWLADQYLRNHPLPTG